MPAPTVYTTALIDKLDEFLLEFREHDKEIAAGVASVGDAAAYALVWELGNIRQSKKGSKTVQGTTPDGETVWLSIQAPHGYIRIHENDYIQILKQELGKCKFDSTNPQDMTEELEAAAIRTVKRCAKLVQDTVPVYSGKLHDSIEIVEPDDVILEDNDDTRTLVIG